MTNPEKKALIQLMMSVCGIIMAMFPFIMPIIPSIAAGSVIGFGAAFPLFSGSLRKAPSLYADTRYSLRDSKAEREMAEELVRRLMPRSSERCSRRAASSCFWGLVARRMVA